MARLALHHARQTTLCTALETLIDSFPKPDDGLCLTLGAQLTPQLQRYHAVEEGWFFPALERRMPASASLHASLRRLEAEHREDQDAASDLASELAHLAKRRSREDFEPVAYQARALFRNVRRHVAGEADVILPLARRVLRCNELAEIERAYERLATWAGAPIGPVVP